MSGVTKRQQEALAFIQRYIKDHGYSPNYEEIGAAIGLASTSTVHKFIVGLEERGYVKRLSNKSRSVQVVDPQSQAAANANQLRRYAASFATAPTASLRGAKIVTVSTDLRDQMVEQFTRIADELEGVA